MAFHESFDSTVQKSQIWLKDVMAEAGLENPHQALMALRAVLHALRDRLTPDEAVQFAAQMPMLVRGLYYEGWVPAGKPVKERRKEDFLQHIQKYFRNTPEIDPELISRAVFRVLDQKISSGEINDIKQMMPPELRAMWPEPVVVQGK
jgi:uncharacterized protein (DUF2267 family)